MENKEISNNRDFEIGQAGEFIVCADLISKGYNAFQAGSGLSYDVVVDIKGKLYRIQVKTCRKPALVSKKQNKSPGYIFHVRRMGKGLRKRYSKTDLDIFAFVALDKKQVAYMLNDKDTPITVVMRLEETQFTNKFSKFFWDYTWEKCLEGIKND